MLFLVALLKAYAEVLVLCMAARGVLRLALRQRAEENFFYRIVAGITRPWLRLARRVTPRFIADRYVWLVAGTLVLLFWVVVSTLKVELCQGEAATDQACRDVRSRATSSHPPAP